MESSAAFLFTVSHAMAWKSTRDREGLSIVALNNMIMLYITKYINNLIAVLVSSQKIWESEKNR